ncbi:MAG: bifunctional riboflavin kinase/FAD synthetase [Bacteroidota bacterium]|nr:bifunctional riboflavin kinase/FAD synthetase [Bacteroidota bacterium]
MTYIIRNPKLLNLNKKYFITVGTFDGVHLGHQKIITHLVKKAKQKNCGTLLLTFDPHPRKVVQPSNAPMLLQTIEERSEILSKLGLEIIFVQPFTKAFSKLNAEEYVRDILVNQLNVEHLLVGYNHRFGKNRTANIFDLKKLGKKYKFSVGEIQAHIVNKITVSSTKIRHAINNGNIKYANSLLGHTYKLKGIVMKGRQNGKKIGFPTANVKINEREKILPKNGVYAVKVNYNEMTNLAMMNIGTNPTFSGNYISNEVHLINWDGNLYKKEIEIFFIERIRDEKKFNSIQDLSIQLQNDKNYVLKKFKNLNL